MKQIKQETGRSMVEMLGVLAVIGVLSVGGIAGYTIAMNKHRANSVVSDLMKRAVIVSSQRQLNQPANMNDFGDKVGEYPVGNEVDTSDAGKFKITVENVSQAVCQNILALSEQWKNASIQANCEQEKNNMTFIFNDDLSGASGENEVPQEPKECSNCAGPCSVCNTQTGKCEDDDSKCAEGESCYNGYCSACEDGYVKLNNSGCRLCTADDANSTTYGISDAEECYRCKGVRFFSPSISRCTLCTAEKSGTTEDECFTCSDTYFYNETCYYCDPEYAVLDRTNRVGSSACVMKEDAQCGAGRFYSKGRCRDCAKDNTTNLGTPYNHAKGCFGIFNSANDPKGYLLWDGTYGRLVSCGDTRSFKSTSESCFACNQADAAHKRYWDESTQTCYYCASGETAPDGTLCDNLTTSTSGTAL